MESIASLILGHIRGHSNAMQNCSSVNEYIKLTKMNKPHVWGTDMELLVVAHLLKTCIHFYMTREQKWLVYRPSTLDKAVAIDLQHKLSILGILHFTMMLYLQLEHNCLQMTKLMRPKSQNLSAVVVMLTTLHLPKKACTEGQQQTIDWLVWSSMIFHSVDEHWQRLACSLLSIPFLCSNNIRQGGAAVVLKHPQNTQNVRGDGNCLFCSFSYLITGNQSYHGMHLAIVAHMRIRHS